LTTANVPQTQRIKVAMTENFSSQPAGIVDSPSSLNTSKPVDQLSQSAGSAKWNAQNRQPRIGVAVHRFNSSYFSWMAEAATRGLRAFGCESTVFSTRGTAHGERAAFDTFAQMGCDASLILAQSLDDAELILLMKEHSNAVLINRLVPEFADRCVYNDDHYGGRVAAEHFIANGHKELAIVTGPQFMPVVAQRTAGFVEASLEQGIEIPSTRIIEGHFNEQTGGAAIEQILQTMPEVSGVFFQNDHMAIGAILTAARLDIKVPEDISIMGYDDIHDACHVMPALTTVHQPIGRIANHAAQLAIAMLDIQGEQSLHWLQTARCYRPEVFVRQSVCELDSTVQTAGHEKRPLTPRELECLHWTAHGKTSWEISRILSD